MTRRGTAAAVALASVLAAGCSVSAPVEASPNRGLVHVHGLGNNPADGQIYAATHTGIFRIGPEGAVRVPGRTQDTMGFTIVGPDSFLGSGHPGPGEPGPPDVGLIRSDDGGAGWTPVSLSGRTDFHALSAGGGSVYGWDPTGRRVLHSNDVGRTWTGGAILENVGALAADPDDGLRVVATTPEGLLASTDGGRTFVPWPVQPPRPLVLVGHAPRIGGGGDTTLAGVDATDTPWAFDGTMWTPGTSAGGAPQAFTVLGPDRYVVATDRAVRSTDDAGRTWTDIAPTG